MIVIDVLGQPCPIPVVKAKKAIAALPAEGGAVQVLVDNRLACENLGKMAAGSGYGCAVEDRPDGSFAVTISVGERTTGPAVPAPEPMPVARSGEGMVVAIGCDSMGRGSEELGKILIKGFLFSLGQLETPPRALCFFNSGVHLTAEGANTLDDLRALEAAGTRILVCGTCVDYYGVKDRVAAGEIVNMYAIVETMAAADNVVNL